MVSPSLPRAWAEGNECIATVWSDVEPASVVAKILPTAQSTATLVPIHKKAW
jgi:hypothetical protein